MYFVRCYNKVIFNVFYKKNVDWYKVNLIEYIWEWLFKVLIVYNINIINYSLLFYYFG